MALVSLKDIRDRAITLTESFTAAQEAVADALQDGTATTAQLHYLEATLTGIGDGVQELRDDLDALRMSEQMVFEDGANLATLWKWERGLRDSLVTFALSVQDALTITTNLERGQDEQVYVSRSGDTLQRIAATTLGDWREWPRLLEANPGLTPGELSSGTVLTIPKAR